MSGDFGLPKGWVTARIADLSEAFETTDPTKRPTEVFRYVDIGCIDNRIHQILEAKEFNGKDAPSRARRIAQTGDILFSTVRPYLKNITFVSSEYDGVLTSTGITILRPNPAVESNFLFYSVLRDEYIKEISGEMDGTLYPAVRDKDVYDSQIPLPPLNEQRRIVAKIEDLSARSRAAKQALDAIPPLLERFRQSVLAAAFRGDLTKRWREQNPDVEPASVLLERIRQERRQRWEEDYLAQQKAKGKTPKDDKWKEKYQEPEPVDTTDLPELPEGWCWASTSELGQVQLGRQRSPKNHTGSNMVPYLRAANVTWGGLSFEDVKTMHFEPDEVERFKLRAGDILLGEASGSQFEVGKSGVWHEELYNCCFQNTLIRVRPIFPEMADYLQRHYFRNANNGDFGRASKGTGIHHIGAQKLETWPVALPPLSEQSELVNSLDRMLSNMTNLASLLERTKDRRASLEQSILAKAFRGELVPQDPNDEPASVLLERIRAEREAKSAGDSDKKRKARK